MLIKRAILTLTLAVTLCSAGSAFGYSFWDISVGKTAYGSYGEQLTLDGVGVAKAQYAVGSYKYTRVDGVWSAAHDPASPGLGYNNIQYKFDAMGLFFKGDADAMRFVVLTGMPFNGTTASEVGYGSRQFGPGDLKIDFGGNSYGVGLRLGGLYWGTTDPGPSQPWFQIHKATGGTDVISARDAGTLGVIELNPQWDHVDNHTLAANSPYASAFYVHNSGTALADTASVDFKDTGLVLGGKNVYAYELSVPWTAFGINSGKYEFGASWRPDCGNDLVTAQFSGDKPGRKDVPEASSIVLALSGLIGLVTGRRIRK